MPNIRSAKKRMRQAVKRTARNREQRSALRTAIKRVRLAATKDEAERAFQQAEELLDRAARKHIVHPNAAARHKARLQKAIAAK